MARLEGFIERFEKDQVLIAKADGSVDSIEIGRLPPSAREGDFIFQACETGAFQINYEITEARRREIRRLADHFFD